jgi:hypothetical protein
MPLVIRNEQIAEFDRSLTEKFIVSLANELRAEHPEDVENFSDEELRQGIAEGIERAESYGLEGDADVKAFVKLLFTVGWYFDHYPAFREVLTEELYRASEKMPYLFESATDEDWEEAASLSDAEIEKRHG